jgi:hypothetical protein
MNQFVIIVVGDNDDVVNMINYTFYKGLTKANYTDYIMYNTNIPEFMKKRVLDFNDFKDDLFETMFSIDFSENTKDDWYDFQNHNVIKGEKILLEHERIFDSQIFNLTDISRKLGFPINYPIIKISELQKIFERSISELYGNLFLYNFINKINDISFSKGICIVTGIKNNNDLRVLKQTFHLRANIINLDESNVLNDYNIEKEYLNKNNRFNLFYKIQTLIKFILI